MDNHLSLSQMLAEARQAHRTGQLQQAESLYRHIVAQAPRHAEALHMLGLACSQQGRHAEAVEHIQQAMAIEGRNPTYHNNLGEVWRRQGQWEQAVSSYRQALTIAPNFADAHYNLANVLKKQGYLPEAIHHYQRAVQLKPNHARAHYNLGNAQLERGQVGAAITAYQRAIQLNPNFAQAHNNLGTALKRQNRLDEAIRSYRQALAIQPDFGEAQSNLASVLQEHEVAAHQSQQQDTSAALYHNTLGGKFLDQGNADAAAASFHQALQFQPNFAQAHFNLGRAHQQQGELEKAEACFRQAVRFHPTFVEAYQHLANVLQALEKREEARAFFQVAARLSPKQAGTQKAGQRGKDHPHQAKRILFLDPSALDYTTDTPHQQPLGGSQSALCYLADAMAQQGHEVYLLNGNTKPGLVRGVLCLTVSEEAMGPLIRALGVDALIILNAPPVGPSILPYVSNHTRLILWTQHAHDQNAVQALKDAAVREMWDAIVLVSDWQRDQYRRHFNIDPARSLILRNATSPAFGNLFPEGTSILAEKSKPPVLVYTSTPFRGLDVLLDAFPMIRAAVPGAKLRVFSSMKVYQSSEESHQRFRSLYARCQEMEGAEYVGSLSQSALATELRTATVLAYPNTFAETSCIAVMEAMASGCWVVTSELGALPETSAGFARLIPFGVDRERYTQLFCEAVVDVLQTSMGEGAARAEEHLRAQVAYANARYNWAARAEEWMELLNRQTGDS